MSTLSDKQEAYLDEVIRLHYEEGFGEKKISRILPLGHTTVGRWITAYARQHGIPTQRSEKLTEEQKSKNNSLLKQNKSNAIFVSNKSNISMQTSESDDQPKTLEEANSLIAKLKDELYMAQMARDAYNEMINVAESKFRIPIRKKAGTKQ